MMKKLTLETVIENIHAIEAILQIGRSRLSNFADTLSSIHVSMTKVRTSHHWRKVSDNFTALKGSLSATTEAVNLWQQKIYHFKEYINDYLLAIKLSSSSVNLESVLKAKNGLAALDNEIIAQQKILRAQISSLEEEWRLLEKKRYNLHSSLRGMQAPQLVAM